LLDGSGVNREVPAPFWEGLGVKFPLPTHYQDLVTMRKFPWQRGTGVFLSTAFLSTPTPRPIPWLEIALES